MEAHDRETIEAGADEGHERKRSVTDLLQVNVDVIEGLHLLRLSTSSSWIVRRDLTIKLSSTVYAEQAFDADIDLEQVMASIPAALLDDERSLIWLPVLRIPSLRTTSLRIVDVSDGQNRALPFMPQTDVRYRLAAALTWLYLSGCFRVDPGSLTLGDIAELERTVHGAIVDYLTDGSPFAFDAVRHRDGSAAIKRALDDLAQLSAQQPLRDPDHPEDPNKVMGFSRGFAQCLEYARAGYLVVVGLNPVNRTPHVRCDLLPAELQVRDSPAGWSETAQDALRLHSKPSEREAKANKRSERRERILRGASGRIPSASHLRLPVPEVADLAGTHVTLVADDEVCLYPAVLHHDHIGDGELQSASGVGANETPISDGLQRLIEQLQDNIDLLEAETVRAIVKVEVEQIGSRWQRRADRFSQLTSLVDKTPSDGILDLVDRANKIVASAQGLEADLSPKVPIDGSTDEGRAVLAKLLADLQDLHSAEAAADVVELTADDDPRDHVAHFYVAEADSVANRRTDNRPVVHAVVRASRQAREDFIQAALFTCAVSTGLLALLALALAASSWLLPTGDATTLYNAEALVALLLLVPGVSVTLLGRIPGDTLHYLVVSRSIRWSRLSLMPPTLAAIMFATGASSNSTSVEFLLPATLVLLLASGLITWAAALDRRSHLWRHDYGVPLGRLITHPELDDHEAGSPPVSADADRIRADLPPPRTDPRYYATVDMRAVVDVCNAALFQLDRPGRRFMVWIAIERDKPGLFRHVVEALEDLPRSLSNPQTNEATMDSSMAVPVLWGGQEVAADHPVVIEASAVISLAQTGVVMAIISNSSGVVPYGWKSSEDAIKSVLGQKLRSRGIRRASFVPPPRSRRRPKDWDPVVDEVVEHSDYFLYNNPIYRDAVFEVPSGNRTALLRLIEDLWQHQARDSFRISYLHHAVHPRDTGDPDRSVVKVGLAFERGREADIGPTMVFFHGLAEDHGAKLTPYDRRAHPDVTGRGRNFDPDDEGTTTRVAVSAGRGDRKMVNELFSTVPEDETVTWQGGTILTIGGYVCRALRFLVKQETPWPPSQVALASNDRRLTDMEWWFDDQSREADASDDVAETVDDADEWMTVWLRWELLGTGGGLTQLLGAVDRWAQDYNSRPEAPTPEVGHLNIEYLTNRLDERGMISGKARYRGAIKPTVGDRDQLDDDTSQDDIRRSMQASLNALLEPLLQREGSFIVVSDNEPKRPMSSERRQSEFSPY